MREARSTSFVAHHVEDREARGARDGVAAVRPAEAAGVGCVHHLGACDDAGERKPRGEALGDGDEVRLDARVLHREELAGAAEPALDLVDDEEDPVLLGQRAEAVHEVGRGGDEAALAEDRLDDHGGDALR